MTNDIKEQMKEQARANRRAGVIAPAGMGDSRSINSEVALEFGLRPKSKITDDWLKGRCLVAVAKLLIKCGLWRPAEYHHSKNKYGVVDVPYYDLVDLDKLLDDVPADSDVYTFYDLDFGADRSECVASVPAPSDSVVVRVYGIKTEGVKANEYYYKKGYEWGVYLPHCLVDFFIKDGVMSVVIPRWLAEKKELDYAEFKVRRVES